MPRLLEEEVAELLAQGRPTTVLLIGPAGSGRTTALRHLAATFKDDARLGLRDTDGATRAGELVTVVATQNRSGNGVLWQLAPWSDDDVLEYLVHAHRERAAAALATWCSEEVEHGLGRWPGVCRTLLDHIAQGRADGVLEALRLTIDEQLRAAERVELRAAALERCLADKPRSGHEAAPDRPLLRAPIVRTMLAAQHMVQIVLFGDVLPLSFLDWSELLCAALRRELARDPACEHQLVELCAKADDGQRTSLLSLLCAAMPGFRPPLAKLDLRPHGYFANADLRRFEIRGRLERGNFTEADLRGADLHEARCEGASLHGVDLRETRLEGATFGGADLSRTDWSDTALPKLLAPGANFEGAYLTGTHWPNATLTCASFVGAGLAGVDWEGADLRSADFRGATFHLGSSRSGLVDSTIAGEGSRTGFYTDESLEDRFQAPEDVRKANLRGTDLRGAAVVGCDFYLVDVRGARLERPQLEWLRRCRAILDAEAAAG